MLIPWIITTSSARREFHGTWGQAVEAAVLFSSDHKGEAFLWKAKREGLALVPVNEGEPAAVITATIWPERF